MGAYREDDKEIKMDTWKEDYASFLKVRYESDLKCMRRLYDILHDKKGVARVEKVTGMLEAGAVNYEELVEAYNDLNKDVTATLMDNDALRKLVEIMRPGFDKDKVVFEIMYEPGEWLKRMVNKWCDRIETISMFTSNGADFKAVASFFRNKVNETGDISIAYWNMLKQLFRMWDVLTDSLTIMHQVPDWFHDGKPDESTTLDKAKEYLTNFDWIGRVRA